MARKPNYRFERFERERKRAAKKAARAQAKADKKAEKAGPDADEAGLTPDEEPGAAEQAAAPAEDGPIADR